MLCPDWPHAATRPPDVAGAWSLLPRVSTGLQHMQRCCRLAALTASRPPRLFILPIALVMANVAKNFRVLPAVTSQRKRRPQKNASGEFV